MQCLASALDHDILKQVFQRAKVNKTNQIKARTIATLKMASGKIQIECEMILKTEVDFCYLFHSLMHTGDTNKKMDDISKHGVKGTRIL